MWLKRIIDRLLDSGDGDLAAEQVRRVTAVLDKLGVYDSDRQLLDAMLDALPEGERLSDAALARVARAIRVRPGEELDLDPAAQLGFWQALAARFPDSAYVHACWGDALIAEGREVEALGRLLSACELEPGLIAEFGDDLAPIAERVGGEPLLRYRIADLSWRLDDPDEAEEVRESYSELLEDHRDEPAAMARLRALGARINDKVAAGELPRVFVRRTRAD